MGLRTLASLLVMMPKPGAQRFTKPFPSRQDQGLTSTCLARLSSSELAEPSTVIVRRLSLL